MMQCSLVNRPQSLLGTWCLYFQATELVYSEDGSSTSSESLVSTYKDSQHQIPDDRNLNILRIHRFSPCRLNRPLSIYFLWGGVKLSLLGTSATNWPIVPAPDNR
jgi:hypothetical protein